jgi:ketosteroid isomerase-like protein
MRIDDTAIQQLLAKEEIRELALLYCRAVDRKDMELLRTLYTHDGTDAHGTIYDGSASGFIDFLTDSLQHVRIGAHFVCNHLIAVNGDQAEGEVYALGYHHLPDGKGGMGEEFVGVRYIDAYRKEAGRWRFASRRVMFDLEAKRSIEATDLGPAPIAKDDPSYTLLSNRLFARGGRA